MIRIHLKTNIQRDLNTAVNKADLIVIYESAPKIVLRDHIVSSKANSSLR